MAKENS